MAGREALDGDHVAAANVRARREALGISQRDLAERLGLTYQQVQKYESAANRMSVGLFMEIARALDTTPAALMESIKNPSVKPQPNILPSRPAKMHVFDNNGTRHLDCSVSTHRDELRIEYEDDGIVAYAGLKQGSGHYRLTCPEREGSGTLHCFPEEKDLVGFWEERGEEGMWRILVGAGARG